jgi:hypothetical protein
MPAGILWNRSMALSWPRMRNNPERQPFHDLHLNNLYTKYNLKKILRVKDFNVALSSAEKLIGVDDYEGENGMVCVSCVDRIWALLEANFMTNFKAYLSYTKTTKKKLLSWWKECVDQKDLMSNIFERVDVGYTALVLLAEVRRSPIILFLSDPGVKLPIVFPCIKHHDLKTQRKPLILSFDTVKKEYVFCYRDVGSWFVSEGWAKLFNDTFREASDLSTAAVKSNRSDISFLRDKQNSDLGVILNDISFLRCIIAALVECTVVGTNGVLYCPFISESQKRGTNYSVTKRSVRFLLTSLHFIISSVCPKRVHLSSKEFTNCMNMLARFRNSILSDIKSSNNDIQVFLKKLKQKKAKSGKTSRKRRRGVLRIVPKDGLCGWCKGDNRPAIRFDFHPIYAECGKCLCMWKIRKKQKSVVSKK